VKRGCVWQHQGRVTQGNGREMEMEMEIVDEDENENENGSPRVQILANTRQLRIICNQGSFYSIKPVLSSRFSVGS